MTTKHVLPDRQRHSAGDKLQPRWYQQISSLAGAASLRGTVKPATGESIPAKLYVRLVPAEKENADDVLRFFTALVQADGTFAINNLPPGRYWAFTQPLTGNEQELDGKLRTPDGTDTRANLRRVGEAAKTEVALKPCQNMVDYQLPLRSSSTKKLSESAPSNRLCAASHNARATP